MAENDWQQQVLMNEGVVLDADLAMAKTCRDGRHVMPLFLRRRR